MKISDIVKYRIDRFKKGYVFTFDDFSIPVDKISALKKVLSRLVESGKIARLSKGKYYKPKEGIAGFLKPDEYQVVKDLLEEDGKLIGYMTGIISYNKLGLTSQISNTIQVGTNLEKKSIKRGMYNIRFIRQRNTLNKGNIYLLQILDSIRFIKRIPDTTTNDSCKIIMNIIKNLSVEEKEYLCKLVMKYNPATRALLGAIFELLKCETYAASIYKSLRASTTFNLNISENILKNNKKWRIL